MRTRNLKKYIYAACIMLLFALIGITAGCSGLPTDDSALREQGFMCVTFDCNGGKIGSYAKRYIYALPGSPLQEPSETSQLKAPVKSVSEELDGWYLGEKAEDGTIVFGEKWDFAADRMPDEDFTLYAKWMDMLSFSVKCGMTDSDDTHLEAVRYLSTRTAEADRRLPKPSTDPKWDGHTFIGYFTDETYATPLTEWPIQHTGESRDQIIHARYVEGTHTVIWNKDDFSKIFQGREKSYYIMNSIDLTDFEWSMGIFTGALIGEPQPDREPVALSNISLAVEQAGTYFAATNFGLFNVLDGATFKNISFADCSLAFSTARTGYIDTYVGLLAGQIKAGTTFEDVRISGTVTIAAGNLDFFTSAGYCGTIAATVDISGFLDPPAVTVN